MITSRPSDRGRRPSTVGSLSNRLVGPSPDGLSRRRVLQGLLAAGGLGVVGGLPAMSDVAAAAGGRLGRGERILVLVTLDGGNDTLNTVIPFEDGRYRDLRGDLAVTGRVHRLGNGLALHPNLSWLKRQHDAGRLATVLGIGEPSLDHSHFSCMARWMGGREGAPPFTDGWLGRYLDERGSDTIAGVAVGNQGVPLALQRRNGDCVGLPVIGDLFGADGRFDDGSRKPIVHAHRALRGFTHSGLSAAADDLMVVQAEAIDAAVDVNPTFSPGIPTSWPQFVIDMELAARVINLDIGARVVHVEYPGFDTHSSQRPLHDQLLADLDRGLARFASTLRRPFDDQVVTLIYSEFGRRAERNGSRATDHGSGGTAFVLGGPVTGGLYGEQPSLRNLDDRGDLRHSLDYRSLYATILDAYLGVDPVPILGGSHERLRIFDPPVYCAGSLATIVGTGRNDTLAGTARRDVIVGGVGADRIDAGSGNDLACGGAGNDLIVGGAGDDRLLGEGGRDRLRGGAGGDDLVGGPGRDQLRRDRQDRTVKQ